MGAVVVGVVLLVVSAVVCEACPVVTPDVRAVLSVSAEVAGAVIEAMAGRLVNVRCCGDGTVVGETDGLCGSVEFVRCEGSVLGS